MQLRLSALLCILLVAQVSCEISLSCVDPNVTHFQAQVRQMFDHAYTAYERFAYNADEVRPLSCSGVDSFGGVSLTLIDSLDTFVLFGKWQRFADAVEHLSAYKTFAIDETVSVFETTIRVLGGLLAAHGILVENYMDMGFQIDKWCDWYDGGLLKLATDLADRIMPAFDTPTGIPYGSINLLYGVDEHESVVASTAGAGSLLLEFGTLSRYTNDSKYYHAAFQAVSGLFQRASRAGLVGNHINIFTGSWVASEAGIGSLVDSYYEYLLKGYILFGDQRLLYMFRQSYHAINTFVHKQPWYLDADMWTGYTRSLSQSSLGAFWPGLQVLYGDVEDGVRTARAHYSVWRKFGCLPEGYNVLEQQPMIGQANYPLRPELVESVFYLHWATNDSSWIGVAAAMMHSIEKLTKVRCGYASIGDVSKHSLEDNMPSFVISETFKYLYLVFTARDEKGGVHWARSGDYVFTTEAHPLRVAREDIRQVLGNGFDEEFEGWEGTGRNQKCKRRSSLESKLPCGYSMHGNDYPKIDLESLTDPANNFGITPEIAREVTLEIQRRYADDVGGGGVREGEVIFGKGWACRIVKIEGHVVSFERLDEVEAEWERYRWELMEEVRGLREEGGEEAEAELMTRRRDKKCRRASAIRLFRNVATCWLAWM